MKRVTGLGGIFFKCDDPAALREWYRVHLGIDSDEYGFVFPWADAAQPGLRGYTKWSPFRKDTTYFDPSEKPFMINFRVADLHRLMRALKEEGVEIVGETQDDEFGKFAWILDIEGNKVELWEPLPPERDPYFNQSPH